MVALKFYLALFQSTFENALEILMVTDNNVDYEHFQIHAAFLKLNQNFLRK